MSDFEDHLESTRDDDGEYDLDKAQQAYALALLKDKTKRKRLAESAAAAARNRWSSRNRQALGKQMQQAALSPDLELDLLVPLGESRAVTYGDLDRERIRSRMDLRTKSHLDENRAFDAEMTHWQQTNHLLPVDKRVRDLVTAATDAAVEPAAAS